ncbi:hypothetical protein PanWU01x14_267160 [Parasponia andersonii]|uniref:Uncharacterized protein n=1 Tax=Parasponia andersonii TaxID=3476 RepID=A0A2P5B6I0_PARAD|nr:hypothetical protein PanWU01x14_267160 [Parasponia andersonii]
MASYLSSYSITDLELITFHHSDRQLYCRLVFGLRRDPAQSSQVMALWLWIEQIFNEANGRLFDLVSKSLLTLPDDQLNAFADESVIVLNSVESTESFPFHSSFSSSSSSNSAALPAAPALPMFQKLVRSTASLELFHQIRLKVIYGVADVANRVCARVLKDIMKAATEMRAAENIVMSEAASAQGWTNNQIFMRQPLYTAGPLPRATFVGVLPAQHPHQPYYYAHSGSPPPPPGGSSPPRPSSFTYNGLAVWKAPVHDHYPKDPRSLNHHDYVPKGPRSLNRDHDPKGPQSLNHDQGDGKLGEILSGLELKDLKEKEKNDNESNDQKEKDLNDQKEESNDHQKEKELNDQKEKESNDHQKEKELNDQKEREKEKVEKDGDDQGDVPPEDRSIFLTFSKGYPLSEKEVKSFFMRKLGASFEALYMQEVGTEDKQCLFARLVVRSASAIDAVLGRSSKVKFSVHGKHVWARKYVQKASTSTNSGTVNGSNPTSPSEEAN